MFTSEYELEKLSQYNVSERLQEVEGYRLASLIKKGRESIERSLAGGKSVQSEREESRSFGFRMLSLLRG